MEGVDYKKVLSFWETALFQQFHPAEILFHAVVPTVLMSCLSINRPTSDDPIVNQGLMYNDICVVCHKQCKEEEFCRLYVRILFAAKPVVDYYTKKECVLNRSAIGLARACSNCSSKPNNSFIDSDSEMTTYLLDEIETICESSLMPFLTTKVTGAFLFKNFTQHFFKQQAKIVHKLGKLNNSCGCCKKEAPKKRCIKCHFIRYCDKTCQLNDWKGRHKFECNWLKNTKFIFDKDFIKIK